MKDKLNVAIVGFGGMGEWHYNTIKSCPFMNLTGIYDISEERQNYAKNLGINVFESPERVGLDKGTDAVLIATPNDFHLPYAEFFAPMGKHIITEKPATFKVEDFEKMRNITLKHGVKLCVHQNRRWDPDFLSVVDMKSSGVIGEIYDIESSVTGSHGIPGGWRKIKEKGGGMMLDWGVHLIDQLLQFDKTPIIDIQCDLSHIAGFEVDDGFTLRLMFESGLRATVIVDTNCFINRPRWRVLGLDGSAVIEDWSRSGKIVRVKEREDKFLKGINAGNGFTKTMADRSSVTVEELPLPEPFPKDFAFYRSVLDTVNGKEPVIKEEEVSRVLKVMEFALKNRGACRI